MIFTVLLNPTIDQLFLVENFQEGGTYKVQDQYRFPVGKAISVALTLHTLQIPVHVIALIGEPDIQEYDSFLSSKQIPHQFVPIPGKTRSNLTIIDKIKHQSTHLRLPGFAITRDHLKMLNKLLENNIHKDDFIIFSGSMPEGCPEEYYFTPSELVHRKQAHFIADINGVPLKNMLLYHPFLIKSNLEEMGTILNHPLIKTQELDHFPDDEELYRLLEQCEELNQTPSRINVLTLAQFGAIAFTRDCAYHAYIHLSSAPFTVGCGDAFLGGLIAGIHQKKELIDTIRLATACGAANTQIPGSGILRKSDVDTYMLQIIVRRLR